MQIESVIQPDIHAVHVQNVLLTGGQTLQMVDSLHQILTVMLKCVESMTCVRQKKMCFTNTALHIWCLVEISYASVGVFQ